MTVSLTLPTFRSPQLQRQAIEVCKEAIEKNEVEKDVSVPNRVGQVSGEVDG